MDIKQLVIRELQESEERKVNLTPRGGVMRADSPVAADMVEALSAALSRRATLIHGSFDPEKKEETPFVPAFESYVEQEPQANSFLALADVTLSDLVEKMNNRQSLSSNAGYVIFSHYQEDRYEFLMIALVRNRPTISLDNELHPTQIDEVDLDKLHQAAKINLTNYRKGKDSYLSFIGSKEKGDVSQYFAETFGCTSATPSKKATGDLIKAAKEFCSENGMKEQQEQIVEDVVSYMNRQRSEKQSAQLPDVEQIFDQYIPPEQAETLTGTFGKFANSDRYQVSHEFQPHRHTLNAVTKVKAKADNWQLDFAKRAVGPANSGQEIEFDEASQTLTIRRIPSKVVEQLRAILAGDEN